GFSCAGAGSAIAAAANVIITARMIASSGHVERDAVNDVVVVARRIGDELAGLTLPDPVASARHDGPRPFRLRHEFKAESAEGIATEILAELGSDPGLAAVGRYLDRGDAVASIPGNAADGEGRAELHLRIGGLAGDEGVHRHLGDRRVDGAIL